MEADATWMMQLFFNESYDGVLEAGARLGELSVVMKGERLPADTAWAGAPALACYSSTR